MYTTIRRRVLDSYRKNSEDVWALACRRYPGFIYGDRNPIPNGQVPVFAFHSVEPDRFERQLRHLAENGYQALNAEQLHEVVSGRRRPLPNAVALTFDDGWGSLWSVAYPLLKRYGLNAIAFIIPGAISDDSIRHSSLENVWAGDATREDVLTREHHAPLCSWQEIREMQRSGLIDFQSHTNNHNTLFMSDELVDFVNPSFEPSLLCGAFSPVIRKNGCDVFRSELGWGYPVYKWGPALASESRYIEDERLGQFCTEYVRQNGGAGFFLGSRWKNTLGKRVEEFESKHGKGGHFQSPEQRFQEICDDLKRSKEMIEGKSGSVVKHLCYPWYKGSALAVEASRKVGYISNYWGILGKRTINSVADDPYYMTRINEEYILCLPGTGRMSLHEILLDKARRLKAKGN